MQGNNPHMQAPVNYMEAEDECNSKHSWSKFGFEKYKGKFKCKAENYIYVP